MPALIGATALWAYDTHQDAEVTEPLEPVWVDWEPIPYMPAPRGSEPENYWYQVETDPGEILHADSPKVQQLANQLAIQVISRHLDPLVRDEFVPDWQAGKIQHKLQHTLPFAAGLFGVLPNGQPILAFNTIDIMQAHSPRDARWVMSVISHETVHYLQWKRSTDPMDREHFYLGHKKPAPSPQGCVRFWHNEREAYVHQCRIMNSWDSDIKFSGLTLCDAVEHDAAFSQKLFSVLTHPRNNTTGNCDQIYATLAGHPNPSQFDGFDLPTNL